MSKALFKNKKSLLWCLYILFSAIDYLAFHISIPFQTKEEAVFGKNPEKWSFPICV